ncbi:hypothetical protein [Herbidospora sp. RD11066]
MWKYADRHATTVEIIAAPVETATDQDFGPAPNIDESVADTARDMVKAMKRDVITDGVSLEDLRAKLRSTINRLLPRHGI